MKPRHKICLLSKPFLSPGARTCPLSTMLTRSRTKKSPSATGVPSRAVLHGDDESTKNLSAKKKKPKNVAWEGGGGVRGCFHYDQMHQPRIASPTTNTFFILFIGASLARYESFALLLLLLLLLSNSTSTHFNKQFQDKVSLTKAPWQQYSSSALFLPSSKTRRTMIHDKKTLASKNKDLMLSKDRL